LGDHFSYSIKTLETFLREPATTCQMIQREGLEKIKWDNCDKMIKLNKYKESR